MINIAETREQNYLKGYEGLNSEDCSAARLPNMTPGQWMETARGGPPVSLGRMTEGLGSQWFVAWCDGGSAMMVTSA